MKVEAVKLTDNQKLVLGVLNSRPEGKGFAVEVKEGVEGKSFNSVNATLASMASKGLVSKAPAMLDNKMLTQYTITEAGKAQLEA